MYNISRRKTKKLLICLMFCFAIFCMKDHMISAKSKPTTGVDDNGNTWTYDKNTKTLTFSGTKDLEENILDGHSPYPDWFCWDEETEHVVIEDGITGLAGGEFCDFTELKTVILPNSVTYIGDMVFYSCLQLESIQMPKNIRKIGDGAFFSCNLLKSIEIPRKVKSIGNDAFYGCSIIAEIVVPDSVEKIGRGAFGECDELKKIKLSKNLNVINEYLFVKCKKLTSLNLPESIKTIKLAAFKGSGIKRIVIPKNVTSFNKDKYEYGSEGVFESCKNLKVIEIKSKKIKSCYKGAFSGISKNAVIKVPVSKLQAYKCMLQKSGLSKKVKVKS